MFLIPLIVILACQGVKLGIFVWKKRALSIKSLVWEGFWVGKFPSTHTAVLFSSLYILIKYSDNQSVVIFATVVTGIFLYGLVEDRKRNEILMDIPVWSFWLGQSLGC